jgi:hypothetical protein
MKGAIVHGVLLVTMLAVAYQTWTRDKTVKPSTGTVVLWTHKPAELQAIVHETPERTVRVERRGEGAAAYLWGSDARVTTKTLPPAADADPEAAPETEQTTTTREFPVGEAIDPVVAGLSAMRAIRDLGTLGDEQKKEYELAEAKTTLSVVFAGGTRTLLVGDRVLGGKDRYVLDIDSGKGYVIAGALLEPLEGGERSLTPKQAIPTGDEVATIEIAAGEQTRTLGRVTVADDAGKQIKTWGDARSGKADQTAANFLSKVETSLRPVKYDPELDAASLTRLVAMTYKDARGKVLDTLTVYKRETTEEPPPPPPPAEGEEAAPPPPPTSVTEYYIVSQRTRVPAQVNKAAGDQVEQNIQTVFESGS